MLRSLRGCLGSGADWLHVTPDLAKGRGDLEQSGLPVVTVHGLESEGAIPHYTQAEEIVDELPTWSEDQD